MCRSTGSDRCCGFPLPRAPDRVALEMLDHEPTIGGSSEEVTTDQGRRGICRRRHGSWPQHLGRRRGEGRRNSAGSPAQGRPPGTQSGETHGGFRLETPPACTSSTLCSPPAARHVDNDPEILYLVFNRSIRTSCVPAMWCLRRPSMAGWSMGCGIRVVPNRSATSRTR